MSERLGFIGLGNMGHPMAKNLEKAGFALSVYNRTVEKTASFREKSTVCDSIAALVENSDVIFTMLTNDAAVVAVYDQILISEALSGKLFVDMSTISRETSLAMCERLESKGAALIDAPVAGSTQPAAQGTLIIMVGGDEKNVTRARPYLEKMGKMVKHLGKNGNGLAAKISVNYFLSIIYQGLAESVLLADKSGISRSDFLDIINESASGSGATKVKTPLLIENNYQPAFALDLMLKDMGLARKAGATYPLGKASLDAFQAAHDAGFGQEDVIGIINYLKACQA